MHLQSPPLTIGGTVLKESDDLVILGVTFDSKMPFEKHLRSVSRAASQKLGISKSWRVFHDRSLLLKCFRGFVLKVLVYCSAVWCSTADSHLKLLNIAVSDARFLTGSVFECDIAHRRSVAVLCMLYKIRCITRTVCASAGYTRCSGRISVYLCAASLHNLAVPQDFYSPQCPSETILLTPYSMVWDCMAGFNSRANALLLALAALSLYDSLLLFVLFSSFCL